MNKTNKSTNKMGTEPMNKLMFSIAIPIVLSMSVQALYTMVDSIYVSKIGETALTATALALPIITMMTALGEGIAVGMNSMLSRALGQKNGELVKKYASSSILLMIVCYLFCVIFCIFFAEFYFKTQTTDSIIIESGIAYIRICMGFSFGMFAQVLFERMLISAGKTTYSMITQPIGAVINIVLDPILIFGYFNFPEMGITGAALATVIGQLTAGILALFFNYKKNHEIPILFSLKPDFYAMKKILSVGIPTTLMSVVTSIMFIGYNMIVAQFSTTAVAVFAVCRSVTTLFYMLCRAVGSAMVPIIAFNYGAKNKKRMNDAIRIGLIYNIVIMVIGTLIFELGTKQVLLLYNASDDMMHMGIIGIRFLTSSFIIAAIKDTCGITLQALGRGVQSMFITIVRHLVVLLPLAYIFSLSGNLNLVWVSVPIADTIACVAAVFLLIKTYKQDIQPMV